MPSIDVIKIVELITNHHRVFEAVVNKLLNHLDDEVLALPERQVHALKHNGREKSPRQPTGN